MTEKAEKKLPHEKKPESVRKEMKEVFHRAVAGGLTNNAYGRKPR